MPYNDYWHDAKHIDDLESFWNAEAPEKREPLHECVRELRGQIGTVLDVGCGTAQDYPFYTSEGWRYLGMDPSIEMIRKAWKLHPDVVIMVGDVVETTINSNLCDLVSCMSVICHLPINFVDVAIENMARITKKNLIISIPYIHTGVSTPTTSEADPLGYIRNRFSAEDLWNRISRFADIKSMHRFEDVVAIRAEAKKP
jgi:SAM-dependent methyltransferase